MDVPIVVVCYNNYRYVENTLKQIKKLNLDYYKNIIIMNNCSNDAKTIEFLNTVDVKVIHNSTNAGPWITTQHNTEVYNLLPDKFVLTDPDLELNEKLPSNFIDDLVEISNKYNCQKTGFSLDISDFDKMYQFKYSGGVTIFEWEKGFWENRINDDKYEIYWAGIDTTFCLFNKNYGGGHIRVAGNFTAKHLPWYVNNKLLSLTEVYNHVSNTTSISSISCFLLPYLDSQYSKTEKDGKIQLLSKDGLPLPEEEVKLTEEEVKLTENEVKLTEEEVKLTENEVKLTEEEVKLTENEVLTLKSEFQSLKSEIQSLKSEFQSLKSEIQSLKSEIQSLKTLIQSCKSEVPILSSGEPIKI